MNGRPGSGQFLGPSLRWHRTGEVVPAHCRRAVWRLPAQGLEDDGQDWSEREVAPPLSVPPSGR